MNNKYQIGDKLTIGDTTWTVIDIQFDYYCLTNGQAVQWATDNLLKGLMAVAA